jgi:hypothetical protein
VSTITDVRVGINLESDCLNANCTSLADRFVTQLGNPTYSRDVSLMPVPESLEEWRATHRTARKRADRSARLGYTFQGIDRSLFNQDIHEINTSLPERQGRPMSDGYLKRHNHGPLPAYPCDRHRVNTYGVAQGVTLRAYLSLYRCGELVLISMILGHGDHLANDIMYLLAHGTVEAQAGQGGVFYYNRHDSGEDGLRYYKERVGFTAEDVQWLL